MKNIVNKGNITIDKNRKYLYNFIVTKGNVIHEQDKIEKIYTYIAINKEG